MLITENELRAIIRKEINENFLKGMYEKAKEVLSRRLKKQKPKLGWTKVFFEVGEENEWEKTYHLKDKLKAGHRVKLKKVKFESELEFENHKKSNGIYIVKEVYEKVPDTGILPLIYCDLIPSNKKGSSEVYDGVLCTDEYIEVVSDTETVSNRYRLKPLEPLEFEEIGSRSK